MSHAITIQRPLQYHRVNMPKGFKAYRVNGTPADCVVMGLYHWGGADLILSGINLGSNLGSDIWHSGTVAAAKQGVLLGVQAVAFSQVVKCTIWGCLLAMILRDRSKKIVLKRQIRDALFCERNLTGISLPCWD